MDGFSRKMFAIEVSKQEDHIFGYLSELNLNGLLKPGSDVTSMLI